MSGTEALQARLYLEQGQDGWGDGVTGCFAGMNTSRYSKRGDGTKVLVLVRKGGALRWRVRQV